YLVPSYASEGPGETWDAAETMIGAVHDGLPEPASRRRKYTSVPYPLGTPITRDITMAGWSPTMIIREWPPQASLSLPPSWSMTCVHAVGPPSANSRSAAL